MGIAAPTVGTFMERTAETSTPVAYPSVVNANDLVLVCGSVKSATLVPTLSGFTTQGSLSSTGNTVLPDIFVASGFAAGTEGGTTLAVPHISNVSAWQILCFGGVDQTTPFDITTVTLDQSTATTSTSFATQTLPSSLDTAIFVAAQNSTTATSTPPSGFTETGDRVSGTAAFTVAYLQGLSSGATGTIGNLWTSTAKSVGVLLFLRPAASPSKPLPPKVINFAALNRASW